MIVHCVAAIGCPHPLRRFTIEGDLLATEARLIADRRARAALALKAVAHRDARRFAFNRKMKLSAAAGGASDDHRLAPCYRIRGVRNDDQGCVTAGASPPKRVTADNAALNYAHLSDCNPSPKRSTFRQ
jgi:hypothetical protein